MQQRTANWIGILVGSSIGGYLPVLWGGSLFSFSAIFLSALGAIAGVWVVYKMSGR